METRGDKGRQDLRKADTPSNKGNQEGAQWETKETRQSGRRTHHPTEGNQNEYNERQRETRPSGKADTPSNNWQQEGAQWETKGDKTLAKADTPSNKGQQERPTMGDKGRQDPREGKHTIHQKETRRHKGRQWETRLVSHCTPSFFPLLDGVSAFPKVLSPVRLPEGLVLPLSPIVPRLVSLCWMMKALRTPNNTLFGGGEHGSRMVQDGSFQSGKSRKSRT